MNDLYQNSAGSSSVYATAQKKAYIFPIIGSLLIPIFVGLIFPFTYSGITLFSSLFTLTATMCALFSILIEWQNSNGLLRPIFEKIFFVDPQFILETDLKNKEIPYCTIFLIFINILLFLILPEDVVKQGVFFPYKDHPSLLSSIISVFTSAFLHGNTGHLMGNMLYLLVIGMAVETRIGIIKYTLLYILCIIFAKIFVFVMLLTQSKGLEPFNLYDFHSLGASGAISGLLGIFAVRCYFSKIKVGLPFFGIPFLAILLKVNGTLFISFFFIMNIHGSLTQFHSKSIGINHWAHVGGYLGGFIMAYFLQIHKDAAEESVEAKVTYFKENNIFGKEAIQTCQERLLKNPEDEQALRYFLHLNLYNSREEGVFYSRLISLLVKQNNMEEVIKLLDQFFPKHLNELSGSALTRIGMYYYKNFNYTRALSCFQLACDHRGVHQEKAIFQLAIIFEEMESYELAVEQYKKIMTQNLDNIFFKEAVKRYNSIKNQKRIA